MMKAYEVGIVYYFQADDAEHAIEQFVETVGVDIRGHINVLEEQETEDDYG